MGDHTCFFYGNDLSSMNPCLLTFCPRIRVSKTNAVLSPRWGWDGEKKGTLMVPAILHRIIHGSSTPEPWQKELLTTRPALLPGYKRHKVQYADYPAILPSSAPESSVLGVVVTGLTEGDMLRLDNFEGSSYEKRAVKVNVIKEIAADATTTVDDKMKSDDGSLQRGLDQTAHLVGGGDGNEAGDHSNDQTVTIEATTYVWTDLESLLDLKSEWDFDSFKRDKLNWWISAPESEL